MGGDIDMGVAALAASISRHKWRGYLETTFRLRSIFPQNRYSRIDKPAQEANRSGCRRATALSAAPYILALKAQRVLSERREIRVSNASMRSGGRLAQCALVA
jgi:hypothetical protein